MPTRFLHRESAVTFDPARLRTVHLVPLTAFDQSNRIDVEVQTEHARRSAAAGISVFLPAAGTSEFHSLSADEIVEVVRATRAGAGDDALVFAPVGLQVGHATDVGKRSLEAGADGVMFMPFAHPYLSDQGAFEYYRAVIGALRCPVLIYKKSPLPSNELLLKLSHDPRVVGFKYAWNQMHEFRSTVLADRGRSEWLCGSAERFAPYYLLAGATGYTTGAGNVAPRLTLAMHAAFAAGDWAEGLRLQERILPIEDFRARDGDSFNISMLKHAALKTGLDFGPPRPPQRSLTTEDRTEIDALLEPILEAEARLVGVH